MKFHIKRCFPLKFDFSILEGVKQRVSESGITDIKYHTNGYLLAITTGDNGLIIYKISTNEFLNQTKLPSRINETAWINAVDFKTISACQDGSIYITEVVHLTNEIQFTHPYSSPAICIASSNRVHFIAGFQDGSITIRMNSRTKIHTINPCSYAITAISITPTENIFAAAGVDGVVRIFTLFEVDGVNPSKFTCLNTCFVSPSPITDLFFVSATNDLVVSSLDNTIRVFKYPSFEGRIVSESFKTGGLPTKIDFFRGAGTAYSSQFVLHQAEGGVVMLYDILAANSVSNFGIFEKSGIAICCHPQIPQFAAGGGPNDGNLIIVTIQPQSLTERITAGAIMLQRITGLPSIKQITRPLPTQTNTQKTIELMYPIYSEDFPEEYIPPSISEQIATATIPRAVQVTPQPIHTEQRPPKPTQNVQPPKPIQLPHLSAENIENIQLSPQPFVTPAISVTTSSQQPKRRGRPPKTNKVAKVSANVQTISTISTIAVQIPHIHTDSQFQQIQVPDSLQEVSSVKETQEETNTIKQQITNENKEETNEENNEKEEENEEKDEEENESKEEEETKEENEESNKDENNKNEDNDEGKGEEEETKEGNEEKDDEEKEAEDDKNDESKEEGNEETNDSKDESNDDESEKESKEDSDSSDKEKSDSSSNSSSSDSSEDDEKKSDSSSQEKKSNSSDNEEKSSDSSDEKKSESDDEDKKSDSSEDKKSSDSSSEEKKSDSSEDDEKKSDSDSKSSSNSSSNSPSNSSNSSKENSSESEDDEKEKEREESKPKRGRGRGAARGRGRGRKK
ncbi:hypothetical protein TVAG_366040 [Trichomonas vaginalis G3]|uniref:Uncharacterized protein n=1 Tax=Trichomonas vaginalis (strain ATCC PRA-98 / G3) TaxID=412133 RepID=A2DHP8_TRIV3|nr:WD40 repeat-like family [Trichomonas vaginalis G3]EAY20096.1 hypothetical protein TVAG_366040 [Trichomonas vaginalis G3]KAI5528049.1 WD40 repeat-like family [Trichomonas vaginalis G3]|eukprot:XP_001581082.1 hypothetical protein [Trichomonas vaginalis G3]